MSEVPLWYGGAEQEVSALGKTWRLSRQTRHVWREFAAWARAVLPDPIEAVAKQVEAAALADARVIRELLRQDAEAKQRQGVGLSLELAGKYVQLSDTLAQKAIDKAASYLDFGGPELSSLLRCPEGQIRMLWLLLKKHQPGATEDEADDLYNDLGPHKVAAVFRTAAGRLQEPAKNGEAPGA